MSAPACSTAAAAAWTRVQGRSWTNRQPLLLPSLTYLQRLSEQPLPRPPPPPPPRGLIKGVEMTYENRAIGDLSNDWFHT